MLLFVKLYISENMESKLALLFLTLHLLCHFTYFEQEKITLLKTTRAMPLATVQNYQLSINVLVHKTRYMMTQSAESTKYSYLDSFYKSDAIILLACYLFILKSYLIFF